jgi:hypothetical protein
VSEEQKQKVERDRRARAAQQEISLRAYRSYWPLALAIGLFIILMGVITHPIVLGIGVVIAVVAAIGWGLERR